MTDNQSAAGEAVPVITTEIDRLIDPIEEAGGSWYIAGGSQVVEPTLCFNIPSVVSQDHLDAMLAFQRAFVSSAELRQTLIEHAINIGAFYVELGNDRPVIEAGSDERQRRKCHVTERDAPVNSLSSEDARMTRDPDTLPPADDVNRAKATILTIWLALHHHDIAGYSVGDVEAFVDTIYEAYQRLSRAEKVMEVCHD